MTEQPNGFSSGTEKKWYHFVWKFITEIWDFLMKLLLLLVVLGGLQYIIELIGIKSGSGTAAFLLGIYLLWYFKLRHDIKDK